MSDPDREGMDPRPTPREMSEWTARSACGEAIPPGDVLRLLQEVRRLEAERDNYRVASLGLFDPVKVSQVVAQLQRERDESREIATYLMKHSVTCWSYQAELQEAYQWMREPIDSSSSSDTP